MLVIFKKEATAGRSWVSLFCSSLKKREARGVEIIEALSAINIGQSSNEKKALSAAIRALDRPRGWSRRRRC